MWWRWRNPVTYEYLELSGSIVTLSYLSERRSLVAMFSSGATYRYAEVPPETWAALKADTANVGAAFNRLIKLPAYAYERIAAPRAAR